MAADGGAPGGGRVDTAAPAAPPPAEVEALVRSLIEMMGGGGITELDVAFGSVSIRLRGHHAQGTHGANKPFAEAAVGPPLGGDEPAADRIEHVITAPMIGTFYAAASPGEPPLVGVGDRVEVGQVVGIIEAMKIMNEITADRAGEVTAVLVASAQPVEYGSPLIRLRSTDGRAA